MPAPKLPRHARPVCEKCGATPPAAELIFSRGAWWHRKCARVFAYLDGEEYVGFPSDGRVEFVASDKQNTRHL